MLGAGIGAAIEDGGVPIGGPIIGGPIGAGDDIGGGGDIIGCMPIDDPIIG